MSTGPNAPAFPLIGWLQRRPRWQWRLLLGVVAIYALWRLLRAGAGLQLDRWWYATVTEAPIWRTMAVAKVQLALAAGLVTALVLGGSLWLTSRVPGLGRKDVASLTRRYRDRMGPAHRWLLIVLVVFLTVRTGRAAVGQWQSWVLFRHGPELDTPVPEIGGDLGFYLFDLPFYVQVSSWIRQLLLVTLLATAFAYAVSGALRLPIDGHRSARPALAHLGLLGAALAGAQALDHVLVQRPSLALNRSGGFTGAGYTEVNVLLPASWILAVICVLTGAALVLGARSGRWRWAIVAVGVAAAAHVVLLVFVPALVNRFVVAPSEASRQVPYLVHHLEATRVAFGLDTVEEVETVLRDGETEIDPGVGLDPAWSTVPLFEPDSLADALQVLAGTTATRVRDVDLDRYELDDGVHPVLVAAREVSRADLPEKGWTQSRLVYTHGDGVVAVPADEVDADGRPDVSALATTLQPAQPELYFGQGLRGWYAIVGTKRAEQDGARFGADTGIALSSFYRRAILGLSAGELQPLLSGDITDESQLLYRRDVTERLEAIAPFLTYDGDPYPVITTDRVVWVVPGYTTSRSYPYSQFASLGSRRVNYAQASIWATVDAYDGSVHLYRTAVGGADDPILQAWEGVFPGLVEPISAMDAEVREHLRYPTDLLATQLALLGRYHVEDAETLFSGTERWSVAGAAATGVGTTASGTANPVSLFMPADDPAVGGHWVAVTPFSPGSSPNDSSARDELAAMAIADHDNPERLRLLTVAAGAGRAPATPRVAQSAIDADPQLARTFTLLNANGSKVQFGPMTPLMTDGALFWVRPIVVRGTQSTAAPRLYGVLAVSSGLVGLGETPADALAAATAG